MSCEYATGDRKNCNMTGEACLVISDEDQTAYRHCLRRDWKYRLEEGHLPLYYRGHAVLSRTWPPKCPE
jgi:hypothetical protein